MGIDRRQFLQYAGLTGLGLAVAGCGAKESPSSTGVGAGSTLSLIHI